MSLGQLGKIIGYNNHSSFYRKLDGGWLRSNEIEALIAVFQLEPDEYEPIFFDKIPEYRKLLENKDNLHANEAFMKEIKEITDRKDEPKVEDLTDLEVDDLERMVEKVKREKNKRHILGTTKKPFLKDVSDIGKSSFLKRG